MTKDEAKMFLNDPKIDSDKIVEQIWDFWEEQMEQTEESYEQDILKLNNQLSSLPRLVPEGPTPEDERKIWPSLQADNLHDAEKWRYLEEIANKCNLNTIRQIFKEHVTGS